MEGNEDVDEVMTCSFPGFTRQPGGSLIDPYRQLWREARRLRTWHFDLALIMRFDHWWGAALAALAHIPHRLGYDIPEVRPFLTQAVPHEPGHHEVWQNLTLLSSLRRLAPAVGEVSEEREAHPLSWEVPPGDASWAARWLRRHGAADDRPLVAIHAGAGAAVKLWEPELWAEVIDSLEERRNVRVVLTGSRAELDLAWAISARSRSDPLIACGETTLGQLAALYQRCRLVLGVDSGPMHLAVAVGTPTLHLFGPVDAAAFGPWGDHLSHRVVTSGWPCIPCNHLDFAAAELPAHNCVRDISVDQVLASAESLLSGTF